MVLVFGGRAYQVLFSVYDARVQGLRANIWHREPSDHSTAGRRSAWLDRSYINMTSKVMDGGYPLPGNLVRRLSKYASTTTTSIELERSRQNPPSHGVVICLRVAHQSPGAIYHMLAPILLQTEPLESLYKRSGLALSSPVKIDAILRTRRNLS